MHVAAVHILTDCIFATTQSNGFSFPGTFFLPVRFIFGNKFPVIDLLTLYSADFSPVVAAAVVPIPDILALLLLNIA